MPQDKTKKPAPKPAPKPDPFDPDRLSGLLDKLGVFGQGQEVPVPSAPRKDPFDPDHFSELLDNVGVKPQGRDSLFPDWLVNAMDKISPMSGKDVKAPFPGQIEKAHDLSMDPKSQLGPQTHQQWDASGYLKDIAKDLPTLPVSGGMHRFNKRFMTDVTGQGDRMDFMNPMVRKFGDTVENPADDVLSGLGDSINQIPGKLSGPGSDITDLLKKAFVPEGFQASFPFGGNKAQAPPPGAGPGDQEPGWAELSQGGQPQPKAPVPPPGPDGSDDVESIIQRFGKHEERPSPNVAQILAIIGASLGNQMTPDQMLGFVDMMQGEGDRKERNRERGDLMNTIVSARMKQKAEKPPSEGDKALEMQRIMKAIEQQEGIDAEESADSDTLRSAPYGTDEWKRAYESSKSRPQRKRDRFSQR